MTALDQFFNPGAARARERLMAALPAGAMVLLSAPPEMLAKLAEAAGRADSARYGEISGDLALRGERHDGRIGLTEIARRTRRTTGKFMLMVVVKAAVLVWPALLAPVLVLGGILGTLLASLVFVLRPLAARPAHVLRAQE